MLKNKAVLKSHQLYEVVATVSIFILNMVSFKKYNQYKQKSPLGPLKFLKMGRDPEGKNSLRNTTLNNVIL